MEKIKGSIINGLKYSIALYFIYRSIGISILTFVIVSLFKYYNKRYYYEIEKKQIQLYFYDFLTCLLAKCNTSSNFFNNYKDAYDDYIAIFGRNTFSIVIKHSINIEIINVDSKTYLNYIKETFDSEEIFNFINSTMVCYQMGNNMYKNIKESILLIKEKIEIEQSIEVLIAQKKSEQAIISIMPFLIIFIFTFMASGYLEVMYTTLLGKMVMTIAGILFLLQNIICNKIMKIEV